MNIQDEKYFRNLLLVMKDFANDLSKWSVYNEDKFSEEIFAIKQLIQKMENKPSILPDGSVNTTITAILS